MLASVIAIMVLGLITGGLARLAVPGPDPMPLWLTIAIGLAGSWGGGGIAAAIWGWDAKTAVSFSGFFAAILLVVAYRRFVQKRPITGPDAHKFPERGLGMDRFRQRKQQFEDLTRQHRQQQQQQQEASTGGDSVPDQLRKLGDLRDAGILTDEEFETKKAQLLARM
jgi:uncharacterized membrane protein YeaQ/YmgE (transglycosylase-associated protein family)